MNIETVLTQLSLEEKAALLQGWSQWTTAPIPRLGIPELFLADGPHGLRKQAQKQTLLWSEDSIPATCFPTAATMANSWDPALVQELGASLGKEAAANDVHVVLGPGLNMKRSPLCGRNFEYYSEDPYLAGKLAAACIRGIQSAGPAACPKHFAVNSQELRRMSMDAVIDQRTLREIYLTAFEIAVKEGRPGAIMSSYNQVNGVYANENPLLLDRILRKEWGFDGFVVTDWGADNDHVEGVRSGSNLVMPAPGADEALGLVEAVREGRISEDILNQRLRELLPVMDRLTQAVAQAPKEFDPQAHHKLAQKCAAQSIVLLENDGILPLKPGSAVAVIGDFARTPRYQGAGSSQVNSTRVDSLLEEIRSSGLEVTAFAPGFSRDQPQGDPVLLREAVEAAQTAPAVLLCVGLEECLESEGMDRENLALSPAQQALITAVCNANPNVVLVLSGGAPFLLPQDAPRRAVIHGYLGGQAGSAAMAQALVGSVNPSGKLSETWPLSLEDTPAHHWFPSRERTSEYRESLFMGYRYYDTAGVPVAYPFGHGLSYTTFAYSDLELTENNVRFTLTNTGPLDGAEVVQIYISCRESGIFRPNQELKAFTKIFLPAGESQVVTLELDDKAFRYFNTATDRWEVQAGVYEIRAAASVSDIRLRGTVTIAGTAAPMPYGPLPSYESGRITAVSDEEFSALLGHPIPSGTWGREISRNDAISQLRGSKHLPARLIHGIVVRKKQAGEKKCPPDLNALFVYNMPFRSIRKLTGGMVSRAMEEDILLMVSGHFFRGLGRLVRDFFRNRRNSKAFLKKLGWE